MKDTAERPLGFCQRWLGRAIWLAMIGGFVTFWGLAGWFVVATFALGETIIDDGGGVLADYEARAAALDRSGEQVRVIGDCASACTLYLGISNVCTTPGARWGFHSPSADRKTGLVLLRREWTSATERMARAYPPPVSEWYLTVARNSRDVIWVSGTEMIRYGVPSCR